MIGQKLKLYDNTNTKRALYYWAIDFPSGRTVYYVAYGYALNIEDHFAGDKNNQGIIPLTKDEETEYGTLHHLAEELNKAKEIGILPHIHDIEPTHQFLKQEVLSKGTIYGKNYEKFFNEDTKWWKFSHIFAERKLNTEERQTLRELLGIERLTVV